MKNRLVLPLFIIGLVRGTVALAQDGDQPVTDGFGFTYLAPDAALPGVPVYNMTVGTAASDFATLRVRGDQLPVADEDPLQLNMLCTFRTDVGSQVPQSWRMYRNINQIGAIWNEGQNRAWHVQSLESRSDVEDRYSGLLLQNHLDDGMWIMNDGPPTGGRAFPNALQLLDAKGFAALGRLIEALGPGPGNPRGPWSRLHLFHDVMGTRPHFAHRSQMRNGITLTGNSDHAYVGQWFDQGENGIGAEVDDHSNLVFSIGEDQLPVGLTNKWDNFSFRLFGDLDAASGASSNVEGQELLRVQPVRPTNNDPIEARVGIGDFVTPSDVPSHALDVRGGQVRVRDLPTDAAMTTVDKVMVVDPTGVVGWRPFPTGGGGSGCDWDPGVGNIATAWRPNNTNGLCPEEDNSVSIGANPGAPSYKLGVYAKPAESIGIYAYSALSTAMAAESHPVSGTSAPAQYNAISGIARNATQYNSGISGAAYLDAGNSCSFDNAGMNAEGVATGSVGRHNLGISAKATLGVGGTAAGNIAVRAQANASTTTSTNVGVHTQAGGSSIGPSFGVLATANGAGLNYGIYGAGSPGNSNTYGVFAYAGNTAGTSYGLYAQAAPVANRWAGYFNGNVYVNGTGTITNGPWMPSDAQLKTNVEPMHTALEQIAQVQVKTYEYVQESAPQMDLPSGGQAGFLAQELEGVFPGLVRDFTHPAELDSMGNMVHPGFDYKGVNYVGLIPYLVRGMQELKDQNAALQEQVNTCCRAASGDRSAQGSTNTAEEDVRIEQLVIAPNPFTTHTTVRYHIAQAGRARLEVSNGEGRLLEVLREERTMAGDHNYEWNTSDLSPGTYFVALVVDGNVIVKRAVKVGE